MIGEQQQPTSGWLSGPVVCMVCRYEWVAVRPAQARPVACPRCGEPGGVEEFLIVQPVRDLVTIARVFGWQQEEVAKRWRRRLGGWLIRLGQKLRRG